MSYVDLSAPDDVKQVRIIASELERVDRHSCQIAECLLVNPRLFKLLECLERNPSQRFSTTEAASIVCFQKNYFCAFFKRETGCTFVNWQRNWRAARIAELLQAENISITRAAERYGYFNIRAFERAFKEVYGVSARDYRRAYRTDTDVGKGSRRRAGP